MTAFDENYCTIVCLVLASSLCWFVGCLFAVVPLLESIFRPIQPAAQSWDYHQRRWSRLRQESDLFRSLERWILGVAVIVQKHGAWFLPVSMKHSSSIGYRVFELAFGSPARLNEAVRIGQTCQPWSHAEVIAVGWICAVASSLLYGLYYGGSVNAFFLLAGMSVASVVGYRVWTSWFIAVSGKRRNKVRNFLPHAMDSISMVMSAGGTFREGVATVIHDFPQHPLAQELSCLQAELEHGRPLAAALKSSASRICLPEFDDMVSVLARTAEHGAPGAASFTRLAKQLRTNHLRWMESEVGRAEAKMALPTMLAVFSCMLFVAVPFGIQFFEFGLFQM